VRGYQHAAEGGGADWRGIKMRARGGGMKVEELNI